MEPMSLSKSKSLWETYELEEEAVNDRENGDRPTDDIVDGFLDIFSLKEMRGLRTASIADCLTHTRVPLSTVEFILRLCS